LIANNVKKVKFVDRTFNSNQTRAIEIMKFILNQKGNTMFHFELCADLISNEMLDFLQDVPPGLFEFEIGVQSTYPEALQAVNRRTNWERLAESVTKIGSYGNIHIHLDLIAGLPYEDYRRFGTISLMMYTSLRYHVIQLGFLKLLKGSRLRREKDRFSYVFQEQAPYQVLANAHLSYSDLLALQDIEELVESYYNSQIMVHTLIYATEVIYTWDAFSFFRDFAAYWRTRKYFMQSHSIVSRYRILYDFTEQYYPEHLSAVNEYLKYDFLLYHYAYQVPEWLQRYDAEVCRDLLSRMLNDPAFIARIWPEMIGKTVREMKKICTSGALCTNPETR